MLRPVRRGLLLALALGVAAFLPLAAQSVPVPSGQFLFLDPVGAFDYPTYAVSPPGDTHRLMVVQQGGLIRLVRDNVIQTAPFLNATSWISSGGERGLFSMAFA